MSVAQYPGKENRQIQQTLLHARSSQETQSAIGLKESTPTRASPERGSTGKGLQLPWLQNTRLSAALNPDAAVWTPRRGSHATCTLQFPEPPPAAETEPQTAATALFPLQDITGLPESDSGSSASSEVGIAAQPQAAISGDDSGPVTKQLQGQEWLSFHNPTFEDDDRAPATTWFGLNEAEYVPIQDWALEFSKLKAVDTAPLEVCNTAHAPSHGSTLHTFLTAAGDALAEPLSPAIGTD